MRTITSIHNEQIKHLINLKNKSYRTRYQEFTVEGTRAYTELVQLYTPVEIYITDEYRISNPQVTFDYEITTIISDHIMKKISNVTTPSGIYAIFKMPTQKPLPINGPGIVLVNINDPGNMGTLIRTAAAMNIKEVIIIDGTDPFGPKVIQS